MEPLFNKVAGLNNWILIVIHSCVLLEIIPKAIWNYIIVDPLIRKHVWHLNGHIIYHNFSFLIEQSFWNLSSLLLSYLSLWNSFLLSVLSTFSVFLKSLTDLFCSVGKSYKSLLNRFSVLINYAVLCGLPICFLHPVVSHVFYGPDFSGSRFFRIQVLWTQVF